MITRITTLAFGIVVLASPAFAAADTISDLQAQIQTLLARIAQLNVQQAVPQSGDERSGNTNRSVCPNLIAILSIGSTDAGTGGQVSQLQTFLTDHFNLDEDIITGYFGHRTALYVKQFQKEQGIEQVGWVGKLTRAAIARVCSRQKSARIDKIPSAHFTATPSYGVAPLSVHFTAKSPERYHGVPYMVDYGDSTNGKMNVLCESGGCSLTQESNHTYASPGIYSAFLQGNGLYDSYTITATGSGHDSPATSATLPVSTPATTSTASTGTSTPVLPLKITSISPDIGRIGTVVTLRGAGFTSDNTILMTEDLPLGCNDCQTHFEWTAASHVASDGTSVSFTIPPAIKGSQILVKNTNGISNPARFMLLPSQHAIVGAGQHCAQESTFTPSYCASGYQCSIPQADPITVRQPDGVCIVRKDALDPDKNILLWHPVSHQDIIQFSNPYLVQYPIGM